MVSHLQYVDDKVFLCSGNDEDVITTKVILRNFELVLGLKVNFGKFSILGINILPERLNSMVVMVGCSVVPFPFSYLGLNVGINHKSKAVWEDLIHKAKRRLFRWNND